MHYKHNIVFPLKLKINCLASIVDVEKFGCLMCAKIIYKYASVCLSHLTAVLVKWLRAHRNVSEKKKKLFENLVLTEYQFVNDLLKLSFQWVYFYVIFSCFE